jgi:hypothetical protein
MASLLGALGLIASAAPGAKPNTLKEGDFQTDAKHRRRDNADVLRRGKALRKEMAEDSKKDDGGGFDPDKKDVVDAVLEAAIEQVLKDPKKRLKKLEELRNPRMSEFYADDTPEKRLIDDVKTGLKAAKEHLEFIKKMSEYVQLAGDLSQQSKIVAAGAKLEKISKGILSGLGKVAGAVQTIDDARTFALALNKFALATNGLDLKDATAARAWVDSMKELHDACAPLKAWLMDKAVSAALGGSELAGVAGATLAIVGAQIFIGMKLLEIGLQGVEANLKRRDEADRIGAGKAPLREPPPPQPPDPPDDWRSREERAADAIANEEAAIRGAMHREANLRKEKAEEAIAGDFESTFPKAYAGWRKELIKELYVQLRKENAADAEGLSRASPASLYWDALIKDGGAEFVDSATGLSLARPKGKPSNDELRIEIDALLNETPPCASLVKFRADEAKKHRAGAVSKASR